MTFDTYLLAGAQRSAERRRMPLGLSLLLHGGLLVLGVLYSAMQVEELAAPSLPVIFAPPPAGPPPGPPPARAAARKVVPRIRPRPTALVQPTPTPSRRRRRPPGARRRSRRESRAASRVGSRAGREKARLAGTSWAPSSVPRWRAGSSPSTRRPSLPGQAAAGAGSIRHLALGPGAPLREPRGGVTSVKILIGADPRSIRQSSACCHLALPALHRRRPAGPLLLEPPLRDLDPLRPARPVFHGRPFRSGAGPRPRAGRWPAARAGRWPADRRAGRRR